MCTTWLLYSQASCTPSRQEERGRTKGKRKEAKCICPFQNTQKSLGFYWWYICQNYVSLALLLIKEFRKYSWVCGFSEWNSELSFRKIVKLDIVEASFIFFHGKTLTKLSLFTDNRFMQPKSKRTYRVKMLNTHIYTIEFLYTSGYLKIYFKNIYSSNKIYFLPRDK